MTNNKQQKTLDDSQSWLLTLHRQHGPRGRLVSRFFWNRHYLFGTVTFFLEPASHFFIWNRNLQNYIQGTNSLRLPTPLSQCERVVDHLVSELPFMNFVMSVTSGDRQRRDGGEIAGAAADGTTPARGAPPILAPVVLTPVQEEEEPRTTVSEGVPLAPPLVSAAHPLQSSPPPADEGGNNLRFVPPEKDLLRLQKRQKTFNSVDDIDCISINRNVLVSLRSLLLFLERNFCCKRCHRTVPPETTMGVEVFGLAFGLHYNCYCSASGSLRPDLVPAAAAKLGTLKIGQPFGSRVNCGDFQINRRLVLGLQLCGNGRQDGSAVCGILKLNVNPMQRRWTQVQEQLGKAIIQVGLEILEENLHIECQLSPLGADGRSALDVASDTRWDKRGSTRRYDSLSGCAVAFGLRSDLPIGIEAMSSACIKCKRGIPHDESVCPKNYAGSSKGMEATGAVEIVRRLFANAEDKCFIANLVTDDDSSVRKILTHSYRDLLAAGRATERECPRYKNGQKKPDHGQLPVEHAAIQFLADKGHRVRGYARVIFAEASQSKKYGCGCTKMDAERMKRRLSWTLRLHSGGTYKEFETAVEAVLEHHFNNHEFCGDWCKAREGTEEQLKETELRFRCKRRHKDLYDFLEKHHREFMQEEKLRQLYHQYDTNNVEGFNKFLTKFLPKDRTYCQTIENKARSMLAVGLQSIGYRKLYSRVFALTGIEMTDDDITYIFFSSQDSEKLWRRLHRRKQSVKITRMREQYRKLRDGVAKLKADNARSLAYETGMMGPGGDDVNEERQQIKRKRKNQQNLSCKHCGSTTHSRITSTQCPSNVKYKISKDNPTGTCATKTVRHAQSTAILNNLTIIMCLVSFSPT
jgi:hypothetical protein